ncbi:glycoside hydrolase family 108 protein [Escherichia coli]|uniref:glycoside hydrolase family 108 protein n=1 Tax=Escherichia coli TaxID=562 RepID=UPI0032AF3FE4
MKSKDKIFDEVLGKEGGYVNHPDDKGGPTKWGITEKVARAHGYRGDMRDLTREQALDILEADYWYGPRFDQVAALSPDIAAELCDTGVNMGPTVASRMLQRWLNVFNLRGRLYPAWRTDCICIRGGYSVRCFLIRQTLNIWSCTAARAMFFVKKQRPHPVRQ